jgi:hypothetical protein
VGEEGVDATHDAVGAFTLGRLGVLGSGGSSSSNY